VDDSNCVEARAVDARADDAGEGVGVGRRGGMEHEGKTREHRVGALDEEAEVARGGCWRGDEDVHVELLVVRKWEGGTIARGDGGNNGEWQALFGCASVF
jgi:hypothetical protein